MLTWLGHSASQGFPGGARGKETACQPIQETMIRSLGQKDPLEEGMATHFSILAWRIPWTEEPTVHRVAKIQTRLKQLSTHVCPVMLGSDPLFWIVM